MKNEIPSRPNPSERLWREMGETRERLISYHGYPGIYLADNWDRIDLRRYALYIGYRYSQLDLIEMVDRIQRNIDTRATSASSDYTMMPNALVVESDLEANKAAHEAYAEMTAARRANKDKVANSRMDLWKYRRDLASRYEIITTGKVRKTITTLNHTLFGLNSQIASLACKWDKLTMFDDLSDIKDTVDRIANDPRPNLTKFYITDCTGDEDFWNDENTLIESIENRYQLSLDVSADVLVKLKAIDEKINQVLLGTYADVNDHQFDYQVIGTAISNGHATMVDHNTKWPLYTKLDTVVQMLSRLIDGNGILQITGEPDMDLFWFFATPIGRQFIRSMKLIYNDRVIMDSGYMGLIRFDDLSTNEWLLRSYLIARDGVRYPEKLLIEIRYNNHLIPINQYVDLLTLIRDGNLEQIMSLPSVKSQHAKLMEQFRMVASWKERCQISANRTPLSYKVWFNEALGKINIKEPLALIITKRMPNESVSAYYSRLGVVGIEKYVTAGVRKDENVDVNILETILRVFSAGSITQVTGYDRHSNAYKRQQRAIDKIYSALYITDRFVQDYDDSPAKFRLDKTTYKAAIAFLDAIGAAANTDSHLFHINLNDRSLDGIDVKTKIAMVQFILGDFRAAWTKEIYLEALDSFDTLSVRDGAVMYLSSAATIYAALTLSRKKPVTLNIRLVPEANGFIMKMVNGKRETIDTVARAKGII